MHTAETFGQVDTSGMERHEERLCTAETRRLIRQAQGECSEAERLHSLALVQLGRWLVAWGCSLQERHGDTTPASAL
jgi:hypothetical protein